MTLHVRPTATAAVCGALAAGCLATATAPVHARAYTSRLAPRAHAYTSRRAPRAHAAHAHTSRRTPRAHAYTRRRAPRAHAADALNATDTAHLHYVSSSGSQLFDEGRATGTLPGSMRVHLALGTTFTGTFTIYARGGSIEGRGSAAPHGSGTYESFAGTLTVTGGSGRYAHAHGRGALYGTFDRNNYALVVKTTGSLTY